MGKIEEVNLNGERIFLKKNQLLGWAVISPSKIDGKINWKNLLIGGNWVRFGFIIAFIVLMLLAINEYSTIVETANKCLEELNMRGNFIINPYA